MYNILIVDDEKTERDCIHYLIDNANLNLEIKEASNGKDALQILKNWPTHILLTDVQMPIMNGLELIKFAEELFPDIKVIIFSGYADFEYAKAAISFGVENYILKPIVPEELESTLSILINQIEVENNLKLQNNKHQSYYLQYILQLIIKGHIASEELEPQMISELNTFVYMVLIDFSNTFLENNYSSFYEKLRNYLGLNMESLNISPNQALLLIRNTNWDNQELGNLLNDYIKLNFNTNCYISVSDSLKSYEFLTDTFSVIEQQMEQRFWLPENKVFFPGKTQDVNIDIENLNDDAHILLLKRNLASNDIIGFQKNLKILFDKYRLKKNQSHIYVKFIFSNLVTNIYPYLSKNRENEVPSLDFIISNLYTQNNIIDIIDFVQLLFQQITDNFESLNSNMRKEIFLTKEYISNNYNKELSVEMLASLVFLTPDYLSRLFKKASGVSLSQYIRQFRMEKALTLLIQTNQKVIDIGIAVGYTNYSYFCQSFREYYGKSPYKYRQEESQ